MLLRSKKETKKIYIYLSCNDCKIPKKNSYRKKIWEKFQIADNVLIEKK